MAYRPFRWRAWICAVLATVTTATASPSLAARIYLKNGLTLEGDVARIGTLVQNSADGEAGGATIILVDDDLRRVYVSLNQVREVVDDAGKALMQFEIPDQPVAGGGARLGSLGRILNAGKPEHHWDPFGRRTMKIQLPDGAANVVQGITLVTPRYYRVQTLNIGRRLLLDQRFATSSLATAYLSVLLQRAVNKKDPNDRLGIYQFFLEADRYADAEKELEQIIKDFPDLDLEDQLVAVRNLKANRGLRELKQRRKAGQHEFAKHILKNFPRKDIAGSTLLEVREILEKYQDIDKRIMQVVEALRKELASVKNETISEQLKPMVEEICDELNTHTLERLSSFLLLSKDETIQPTEKLALAISGWLVGDDDSTDNLPIAMSLHRVRELVGDYLRSDVKKDRRQLVTQIRSKEGGMPRLVANLLAQMKPPLQLPATIDGIEGFYKLQVAAGGQNQAVPYLVQLPPEYDPFRRYPTVVTLHGAGTSPGHQIDWWAGGLDDQGRRTGQAARQGYIVIAPAWSKTEQQKYEFTGREHAAVLNCLRDASRRFAIDTDRVYLSGHSMGGNAAWDIGLSHPDQWAGVIPIVATADAEKFNYNALYWRNAKHVPFYFVGGQMDGNKMEKNAYQFDRYLRHIGFDTLIVDYQGRGHESFQDEILNVFDWMSRHRRDFFPKEFACESIRSYDNYFWWVEINEMPEQLVADPNDWPPKRIRTVKITGKINATDALTTVLVKSGRAATTVWLSPELVDFDKRIRINVQGFRNNVHPAPDIAVMLEDARTRGDRKHPFWARIDVPQK